MKRRRFIKTFTVLFIAFIGSGIIVYTFQGVIKGLIKKDLIKLGIDDEQIDKFIEEANEENYWKQFSFMKKEFIKLHYLFENKLLSLPYSNKYKQYKNEIVGHFLLSTDFFINKMHITQKVNYISFYNPYKKSCSVPFSNLFYKNS